MTAIVEYVEELGRSVLLRVGTSDRAVLRDTFEGRHHLPPMAPREQTTGARLADQGAMPYEPLTVLDLGCNIGLTVADYANRWPSARIVGVELDEDNAAIARVNTQRLYGVDILRFAIAGENGKRRYRKHGVDEWAYRLEPTEEGELVDAISMESAIIFVTGSGAAPVDLVKMDIEGGEAEVLNSPGGWPLRVRHLLVEVHEPYTVAEAIATLVRRGFQARPHQWHPSAVWAWR